MSTLIVTNVKNTSSATNNIVTNTDGSATIAGASITLGTSVASTSGTSIDFTGIPSWVKRVTIMFDGVSTNGTSLLVVRLGTSGGIVSSGYTGSASSHGATVATQTWTSGFGLRGATTAAADIYRGQMVCSLLDASNTWVSAHSMALSNTAVTLSGAGTISLGGTLDRLRITTGNGTDTFDAGSINLLLEG